MSGSTPPTCVLATVGSDSHTWNLVYMQLLLEEHGFEVTNLGACTPPALVRRTVKDEAPDLVVVSSINGHACVEAPTLARLLRSGSASPPPMVIGGRFTTDASEDDEAAADLVSAGFSAAFVGADAIDRFRTFLTELGTRNAGSFAAYDARTVAPAARLRAR